MYNVTEIGAKRGEEGKGKIVDWFESRGDGGGRGQRGKNEG